jgi:hypothetical protein
MHWHFILPGRVNILISYSCWTCGPFQPIWSSISYCCSCIRPIVYVPYAAEIDDKAGNNVTLLLGLPVFKFQPGDHVSCRESSCLSSDPEEKCYDGRLKLEQDIFTAQRFYSSV